MSTDALHGRTSAEKRAIDDVLDTIGDERARQILLMVNRKPRGASELSEALDVSLPTVYRHVETLREQDFVVGTTRIAEDGNHYEVFEPAFDSAVISLEGAEYDVRIYEDAASDRFAQLWDDLGGA